MLHFLPRSRIDLIKCAYRMLIRNSFVQSNDYNSTVLRKRGFSPNDKILLHGEGGGAQVFSNMGWGSPILPKHSNHLRKPSKGGR